MEFFKAICSCNNKPILSNQELCLRFEDISPTPAPPLPQLPPALAPRLFLPTSVCTSPLPVVPKRLKLVLLLRRRLLMAKEGKEQKGISNSLGLSSNSLIIDTFELSLEIHDILKERDMDISAFINFKGTHQANDRGKEIKDKHIRFRDDLAELFRKVDKDDSKELTLDELQQGLVDFLEEKHHMFVETKRVKMIFEKHDKDNNKKIGLEEFRELMMCSVEPGFDQMFERTRHFRSRRSSNREHSSLCPKLYLEEAYTQRLGEGDEVPRFLGDHVFENSHGHLEKKAELDPVFVSWTCSLDWKAGQEALFWSPSDLGLVDDLGVKYPLVDNEGRQTGGPDQGKARVAVPIERLCWVLDPRADELFAKVMLPRAFDKLDGIVKSSTEGEKAKGQKI
jgi:hypothetical protein